MHDEHHGIILPHEHHNSVEAHLGNIPGAEKFAKVSSLFKQLSDPTRIRVFWLLCHGEECVINLASMAGLSSPALAHHLKQLRSDGLITSRRDGREVYYKAAETETAAALHEMIELLMEISCPEWISEREGDEDRTLLIREVHKFLTENLAMRYTVEEMSKRFLINTSSLKEVFREVYGKPIGTYMKEYRMEKAMELLKEEKYSISEVAHLVGYENKSKFSAAFKSYAGILPSEVKRGREE